MARSQKQLDNLKNRYTSDQSHEEASKNGRKGGIKSGEVRREKAELKKLFMQYAQMQPSQKEKSQLVQMGFKEDELTNMTSYVVSLFKNGAKGNSKALELSFELLSENNKKELENQKLKAEIERIKLEQEKLRQELGQDKDSYEDLQPLAELLKRRD